MIIDSFTFFNELDMLEFREKELKQISASIKKLGA